MVQHRIAHDQIKTGIVKRQRRAIAGYIPYVLASGCCAANAFPCRVRSGGVSCVPNHGGRAVNANEFPLRQSSSELHQNLSRPTPDIDSPARRVTNQPQCVFYKSVVDSTEVGFRGGLGIRLHFARCVHHLGFWYARQIKPSHIASYIFCDG